MKHNYAQLKFLLSCSALLVSLSLAYGQGTEISGKVTGPEGEGLPGVNIIEKGTVNGTVTDIDGNYSFTVGENATLVFSSVGYATQEIVVGDQSTIDVSMAEDIQSLSEVVVIGYGTQEKRDATGAVASVKAEDFNQGVISSPEELIQGKTAGVQITSASGEPGSGISIRIRGTSSVRSGNDPLFVVDGVPLTGGNTQATGIDLGRGTSSARNPLSFINPQDIASIDILKDASATAIYGSRGANGVVIITTKTGKGQKHAIQYATTLSLAHAAERYDLLDREQFLQGIEQTGGDVAAQDYDHDTDWQDEITRTGFSHKHDLSYANSFATGSYRASISYENQQGIIEETAMERITGRLNFNKSFLNDRLTFGTQLTLSRVNDAAAPITENAGYEGDLLGSTYMANPTWSSDPAEQVPGAITNPNAFLLYHQDDTETDRALINLSLDYDIFENLNFKINTGFDRAQSVRDVVYGPGLVAIPAVANNGKAYMADYDTESDLLEAFFSYEKELGNSSLSAVLGYSYQEFRTDNLQVQGWGFEGTDMDQMVDDLHNSYDAIEGIISDFAYQRFGYDSFEGGEFFISNIYSADLSANVPDRPTLPVSSVGGGIYLETDELQSFFGRVNYSIADKYLFTATLRADGSTKFGGNNQYGYFPSAAVAWRLSDEQFMPEFFDNLKLRLGYGVTGNQSIPHNLYQARKELTDISIDNSGNITPPELNDVTFQNPDLQWEETSQWNAGLDFGILDNRLYGTLNLYKKVTTKLLIRQDAPAPSPVPFLWRNLDADVVNRGVEVSLNYLAIATENMGLDISVNYSYNKNEIEDLSAILPTGSISGQGLSGAYAQRFQSGEPLFTYFIREFTGFDEEGQATYVSDEQTVVGKSPLPVHNMGFSLNFDYNNWTLSAYLNGQFGHYIYNNTANAFFTKGSLKNGRNVTEDVLNSAESPTSAPDASTRFLEKGDFLRMQNLNIGYNFKLTDSFLQGLRVYVSGQNLFVITDYTGLDPEVNVNKEYNSNGLPSLGIDYTSYPKARTFSLGLNATF